MLQEFLQAVSGGTAMAPTGKVYTLDDIVQAHTDMEESRASGKLVVTTETHSSCGTDQQQPQPTRNS